MVFNFKNCAAIFKGLTLIYMLHYVIAIQHFEKYNYRNVPRKPVVMVPGVLGSRLQARLHRQHTPSWLCDKTRDWFDIWLNIEELTPFFIDCWVDDIRLLYSNKTGIVKNQEGVSIRTTQFGSTETFEYLDTDHYAPGSPYFGDLVQSLLKLGYKRGDDLKGAPYDWRHIPSFSEEFISNLTQLIESNYYQHNNQKVVVIGHSMGNLFLYYMFKNKTQTWKDQFIDSFISISSPYIGSVKAVKSVTSGETEGHDFALPKLKLRTACRSFPSSFLMFPNPRYWPKDKQNIVTTFTKNYTVHDYKALLNRIKCPNCWNLVKYSNHDLGELTPPGVKVHCVYSSQVPTAETLIYDPELFPDGTPVLKTGDGDGTVNTFSSSFCLNWENQQPQKVFNVSLPGNNHVGILRNSTLHSYVKKVVTSNIESELL